MGFEVPVVGTICDRKYLLCMFLYEGMPDIIGYSSAKNEYPNVL